MKLEEIIPGATFSLPTSGASGHHMHVVLTYPCNEGKVLCVPWCTYRGQSDESCILPAGSHDKITVKSIIYYGFARKYPVAALVDGKNALTKPVTKDVLDKICNGLLETKLKDWWVEDYYKKNKSKRKLSP